MKACELCGYGARMFCESDQASLCWTCDEKVHGANFLVAKHTRALLCHICQAPSPWKASGPKLTPTLSVCESCVDTHNKKQQQDEIENVDGESADEESGEFSDDDDDEDDDEEDEEEEEGENQVVPWSTAAAEVVTAQPPAASSSSCNSSEEREIFDCGRRAVKRTRPSDLDSDNEKCCSSHSNNEETNCLGSFRPLKRQRSDDQAESSRSTAIISSLKRLQNQIITDNDEQVSETIIGICNLTRDHRNN